MKPTRIAKSLERARPGPNHAVEFPERVALYIHAMHRESAAALLDAFSDAPRARANAYIADLKAIDSAQRQARLTREFGAVPDAADRAQQLLVEASPPLRRAIFRHLPAAMQARFAHLATAAEPCPPAMDALAARLAREVVRARA
ncbi:MAG: hypothetical protein AB1730_26620 [Myxococcota bacterium]|jgi:hypothetical protein